MMNVTTYNVYTHGPVTGIGPGTALFGDVRENTVTVAQPGPAIIDVNIVAPSTVTFAPTAVTIDNPVNWCGWLAKPAGPEGVTEVAFNVVNGAAALLTVKLNLSDGSVLPMNIVNALA